MEVNNKKLEELKNNIESRRKELLKEIAHALGNGQTDAYNALKLQEVQCSAELRVIKHLEDNFENEFIIP